VKDNQVDDLELDHMLLEGQEPNRKKSATPKADVEDMHEGIPVPEESKERKESLDFNSINKLQDEKE